MTSVQRYLFFFLFFLPLKNVYSQIQLIFINPHDLYHNDHVKLIMKDSSHFFGTVIGKPLPDRIIFQTRNGQLEIPFSDIARAIDYTHNDDLKDDLKDGVEENKDEVEKYHLKDLVANARLEKTSVLYTYGSDVYQGEQYIINDHNHLILSTDWGELYFKIGDIAKIKDEFEEGASKEKYIPDHVEVEKPFVSEIIIDPLASQGYVTPNGLAFGKGNIFLTDYLFGGLQLNYGPTDWLSMNIGGVYLPLANRVIVGTAGIKWTPFSTEHWNISIGTQGVYSEVLKITHLGLMYGVVSYGDWRSQLSLFAGYTINHTDSLGLPINTKNDKILVVQGSEQVGKNVKLGAEFFFISNFEIVPFLFSLRYFTNRFTIDLGFVFSLYKTGAYKNTQSIVYYIFNGNFLELPVLPVISASYHF